jgi:DNA replication and repair protein RecF
MYLEWLRIQHVRNLGQSRIDPGPGLNVFTGPNASGKTAILESLYLLARARSFRTARIQEVISRGSNALLVSAGLAYHGSAIRVTTGIEKSHGQVSIRYNGSPVRTVSEQARQLPMVLVTPDSHRLLTGTPKQRRHWLDWAMFHVEHGYLSHWRDYFRALRHRNILLKTGSQDTEACRGWERSMAAAGEKLTSLRRGFVRDLSQALLQAPAAALAGPEVGIRLEPGWQGDDLAESLALFRDQDREAGFTRQGPHRADVVFRSQDRAAAGLLSRGQIKLFVCRLSMAEAAVLAQRLGEPPLFLLDDYRAELDSEAGARLLAGLQQQGWQCFVNATEIPRDAVSEGKFQRFHVEHGEVRKVVK